MIEIFHGCTPTTPAIQPAEVLGADPDHPVEELVGVLLEAAEVLGLEQPHAAGGPRISTARSVRRVWSSLGRTSARRASAWAAMCAWVSCMAQPFRERSRTTLARVTATTRPAP